MARNGFVFFKIGGGRAMNGRREDERRERRAGKNSRCGTTKRTGGWRGQARLVEPAGRRPRWHRFNFGRSEREREGGPQVWNGWKPEEEERRGKGREGKDVWYGMV